MKISILLLNIFIIPLTVMYTNAEHSHNLDDSSLSATQILDNLRIGKTNIIHSHHQNINQAVFIKKRNDENNRKDIQNVNTLKEHLRRKYFRKYVRSTALPYVTNPKACPKGTIWRRGKCVKAYSTDWW